MCGRCACSRGRDAVVQACAYAPPSTTQGGNGSPSDVILPPWVGPATYWPSYNIGPQTYVPVMVSSKQKHLEMFADKPKEEGGEQTKEEGEEEVAADDGDRVLQCMKWGLVPSWHKDDPSSFGTMLNNCRLDGITEKPSFRGALSKGQRCVVVVDGFYEWQTTKPGSKQPFFIYFADNKPHTAGALHRSSPAGGGAVKDEDGAIQPNEGRMLTLAGLFDIWKPPPESDLQPLFTFAIITVDATAKFASIHERMPAVLDGEDAVRQWLDYDHVPTQQALSLLHSRDCLQWYPVSSLVNKVQNKSPECMKKIDPELEVNSKQKTLRKWFTPKTSTTKSATSTSPPPEKKVKAEP